MLTLAFLITPAQSITHQNHQLYFATSQYDHPKAPLLSPATRSHCLQLHNTHHAACRKFPSPSISTVYWRKGKFQCNLQISRKLYSSIGHFPTVQWYYLISARPLSYISTYILFQHEVWKKDLDTWTTYWLIFNWNFPIYNSLYTYKKVCGKKIMNFFTQVGIFTKTLQFLNAKVKAILYQHFTLSILLVLSGYQFTRQNLVW